MNSNKNQNKRRRQHIIKTANPPFDKANLISRQITRGEEVVYLLDKLKDDNSDFLHNRSVILDAFKNNCLYGLTLKDNKEYFKLYSVEPTQSILPCFCVIDDVNKNTAILFWVYSRMRLRGLGRIMVDFFNIRYAFSISPESTEFWRKYDVINRHCPGSIELIVNRTVMKQDYLHFCQKLTLALAPSYHETSNFHVAPERVAEGGFVLCGNDFCGYKSVRHHMQATWPWIEENDFPEKWVQSNDVLFEVGNFCWLYFKARDGAPEWTNDEYDIIKLCFADIGIIMII